jgi:hypothetical protein
MRRAGGMHYTSIENIHKVIDPLFLDDYKKKFQNAMQEKTLKRRTEKLKALQDELARGKYLDPACGSGNFLTESYLSLRRLENDILRETVTDATGTGVLDFGEAAFDPIKVSIQQFYGIEINDFAVSVAKTAIWIAESQMMQRDRGHRPPRNELPAAHDQRQHPRGQRAQHGLERSPAAERRGQDILGNLLSVIDVGTLGSTEVDQIPFSA